MFGMMTNPRAAYETVEVNVRAEVAEPHQLILMLYEGALQSIAKALLQLESHDMGGMSQSLNRAIDIIAMGLKASLDYKSGADLAESLSALYDYMCERLQAANVKGDRASIQEVEALLRELHSAWAEIANDPAVVSKSRNAA